MPVQLVHVIPDAMAEQKLAYERFEAGLRKWTDHDPNRQRHWRLWCRPVPAWSLEPEDLLKWVAEAVQEDGVSFPSHRLRSVSTGRITDSYERASYACVDQTGLAAIATAAGAHQSGERVVGLFDLRVPSIFGKLLTRFFEKDYLPGADSFEFGVELHGADGAHLALAGSWSSDQPAVEDVITLRHTSSRDQLSSHEPLINLGLRICAAFDIHETADGLRARWITN